MEAGLSSREITTSLRWTSLPANRHARRIVSSLVKLGVVVSQSSRAPLRLAFPASLASRWMPGLFSDRRGAV